MTKSCSSCLYLNKANCNIYCEPCTNCKDLSEFVPTTNGDRVRAMPIMDNNELAELLSDINYVKQRPFYNESISPSFWKEWLDERVTIE